MSAVPGPLPDDRITALTVSSWFPSIEDTTSGRFVADQVDVLRATGQVDPRVISFDPFSLSGNALERSRQCAAVEAAAQRGLSGGDPLFAPRGWSGPEGVPVARLPIPSGNRAGAAGDHMARDRASALLTVSDRLGATRRTLVHAHTGYPDGAAAAFLADGLGAPLLITEHASFVGQQLAQPALRAAYAAGVARASRLIAVSEAVAQQLRGELPEFADRILAVPNVVATAAFAVVPAEQRRDNELLTVGYLAEGKGLDTLFAAVAKARAIRPALTLRLIGKAPNPQLDARWRALAGELGIADAVVFEGPRLRDGVVAAMAEASLLVHASRYETFGLVPLEALASGLPVVATRAGVVPEAFGDDPRSLGALVPVDDVDALAAGILDALDRRFAFDPQRLRAVVDAKFGAAAVGGRLLELYETVLREGPRQTGQASRTTGSTGSTGPAGAPGTSGTLPVRTSAQETATERGSAAQDGPVVVVALDADRAARVLGALPAALRARLSVATVAAPASTLLPSDLGAVSTVDAASLVAAVPAATGRRGSLPVRVLRLVRHPLAWARRRRAASRLERGRTEAVDGAIERARHGARGASGPIGLVALDGRDHLAARRAVAAGSVAPFPGGLRWLADRYAGTDTAAAQPSAGSSPDARAGAADAGREDE